MDILVLDSAARGDAEAQAIRQSELFNEATDRIYLYPERALSETEKLPGVSNFDAIGKDWDRALQELVEFASTREDILVIATADAAIAADAFGIFDEAGHDIIAPTVEAAEIETSKDFMKELASELGVPTARYQSFTEFGDIVGYAQEINEWPMVIKADAPAGGKGVKICDNLANLVDGLKEFERLGWMGNGQKVVVEEYLEGPEISLHAWCDGDTYLMFPFAMQDHKTIYDNDEGPMTGGMAVVAPVPGITQEDLERLGEIFIKPFVEALKASGYPFKGVLYPSIKLTADGPKLLEVNARPGDPEAQTFLRMLKSDLLEVLLACSKGRLGQIPKPKWRRGAAVCITLAAKGYPDKPETGAVITGINRAKIRRSIKLFDYGTALRSKNVVVNSGRVLAVTARGRNLNQALKRGNKAANLIRFDGEKPQIRRDIGKVACSQLFSSRVKVMREKIAA